MKAYGERHHLAKLTDAQAAALREYRDTVLNHPKVGRSKKGRIVWSDVRRLGLPRTCDIARELGLTEAIVSRAMRGLSYIHPDDRTEGR